MSLLRRQIFLILLTASLAETAAAAKPIALVKKIFHRENIGSRESFLQPDEHVAVQVVSRTNPAPRTLSFNYETNLVFTGLTSDGTTIEYVGMEWIGKSGRRSGRSG